MTFEQDVLKWMDDIDQKLVNILEMMTYHQPPQPYTERVTKDGRVIPNKIKHEPVDLVPSDTVLELKEKYGLTVTVTADRIVIKKPWIEDPNDYMTIHNTLTEEGYQWIADKAQSRWELRK